MASCKFTALVRTSDDFPLLKHPVTSWNKGASCAEEPGGQTWKCQAVVTPLVLQQLARVCYRERRESAWDTLQQVDGNEHLRYKTVKRSWKAGFCDATLPTTPSRYQVRRKRKIVQVRGRHQSTISSGLFNTKLACYTQPSGGNVHLLDLQGARLVPTKEESHQEFPPVGFSIYSKNCCVGLIRQAWVCEIRATF